MVRKIFSCCLLFISCWLVIYCGPPVVVKTEKTNTYYQPFKTDLAWIVLEWNGRPNGWGSGFLVDKEKGAFYTNKHVSNVFNTLGKGSHKIFFNGKIYNVETIKTPLLVDAALVRIIDQFDFSEFPEPKKFSTEELKVGDRLLIEGFHVHPYRVREHDISEGYNFPLVPIFKDYYRLSTKNLDLEREVVFERLEAEVVGLDKKIAIQGQGIGTAQSIRNSSNSYVEIRTLKDHKFPFGGLSGTIVRNSRFETIGIFTAGPEEEFDPIAESPDGFVLLQQVYKTAYVTPIAAVDNLRQYIK